MNMPEKTTEDLLRASIASVVNLLKEADCTYYLHVVKLLDNNGTKAYTIKRSNIAWPEDDNELSKVSLPKLRETAGLLSEILGESESITALCALLSLEGMKRERLSP